MFADPKSSAAAAGICFCEPGSAVRYSKVEARLPPRAASELPRYLAECCHPDRAVLQLEILLQQHYETTMEALHASSPALRAAVALFACSPWLGQTLQQNPDLLLLFSRPGALETASWPEDFREQFARFRLGASGGLPELLARFKRREYVRIFARELLGLASLPEITGEISALSDIMIELALAQCSSELRARYGGWPLVRSDLGCDSVARFSVLSLGKLGGIELNYSSDIDLLYLYDDGEDSGALPIPAREFFTRLAQELTGILSTVSVDGPVFRVDLRLRPQGSSGEMVTGCGQALRYYSSVAHDWELQALLKLRPSAGDATLGREFVEKVQDLIYSDELSLAAIRTAAQSLERIRRGATRYGVGGLDVKSGPGGLREIEFAVQCLQRVHGGREPWLRSSGTVFALRKLYEKGHIGDAEFRELTATYAALRAIEHRLQCRHGAQAHRMPENAQEQAAIFGSLPAETPRSLSHLSRTMRSASELCARVLRLGAAESKGKITASQVRLGVPASERLAMALAERSAGLARALAAEVGDLTLRGLQRFLAAASTSEQRMQRALQDVEWIERALPIFAQSALATNILASHPEDIVALFRLDDEEPQGTISDQLRIHWRRCILRAVGRSMLQSRPIWEVLREHSESFDRVAEMALGGLMPMGFAIFAVGRLGTSELGVFSDADLVFLRSSECDPEEAGRCAQAMVGMLSGYTREGSVIEVDTRIRPYGSQGPLVVSLRQLAQYFETEAKPWEVLAFGKLRWIAGDRQFVPEVLDSVAALRRRFAGSPDLVRELRQMRRRITDSSGIDSLKGGPGALYDLDFILGLLETRAGLSASGKQLPERLAALRKRELLTEVQHAELLRAAELFRSVEHAVRVVEGRARKWLPESDPLRAAVENLLGVAQLNESLRSQMGRVRAIFDSIFAE